MGEWLFKRGLMPKSITHKQARAFIQNKPISSLERDALAEHLSFCDECSRYAALHVYLSRHLELHPVRTTMPATQKNSLLSRIRSRSRRAQIMKPIYAVGGAVILAIVVFGAWLAIGTLAKEDEPAAVAVPTEEPFVEPSLTPSSAETAAATEAASVSQTPIPEETAEPPLNYQKYSAGEDVYDIAAVDFNGDLLPDIALTDYEMGATLVLLNDGTGALQEPAIYETGEATIGLAAADLNNDSYIDIAVTRDEADAITVLINNGDGTFREPVSYEDVPSPSWVQAGDMDGDGFNDLVIALEPDSAGIMLNNGDGTFQDVVIYLVGSGAGNGSAHPIDLNNDGYLDVALRHLPLALVSILMNNGDGTLGDPVEIEACFSPMWLNTADFNSDRAMDLFVPCDGGAVSILINNGDGTFQENVDIEPGGSIREARIIELNGDSYPDLLVGSTSGGILSSYTNNGDGTFEHLADYPYQDYPGIYILYAFHIVDMNGDGLQEVVGIGGGSNLYVIPLDFKE